MQDNEPKSLISPYAISNLGACSAGISVQTKYGCTLPLSQDDIVFPSERDRSKFTSQLIRSPSGRLFTLEPNLSTQHVQLGEILPNGNREAILELPLDDWRLSKILTSRNGNHIWWLGQNKAMVVDTKLKLRTQTISTSEIDLIETQQYLVLGDQLAILKPKHEPHIGWEMRLLDNSTGQSKSILEFKDTAVLRFELHESGRIVFSGRNELHNPDSGFLRLLDGDSLKTIWSNDSLIPFYFSLSGEFVILTQGRGLVIVDVKTGQVRKQIEFGNQEIYRVASNADRIWCLGDDRRTIYILKDVKFD
ncbi:MAG: hypothetical protein U0930_14315 [Pirellulales bacterium]